MLIPKHSKKSINIVKVGWLKKNKPASLKSLRKKAWALQSEYVRRSENGICHTCGCGFNHLGIARHRAAHRDRKEDCKITFSKGDTYVYNFSRSQAKDRR